MNSKKNEEILKNVKRKISISNFVEEEIVDMKKGSKNLFKGVAVASLTLILSTGIVFAGSKVIENIWKEPEKIESPTDQITEESKLENITEEKAKEIAINKLKEIGFNSNIVKTNHYKEIDSDKIMYRFDTEDNYEISIDGKTGDFYDIWNQNKDFQDVNISITEEEAKEIANKYYKLFGFKEGEYEITKIWSNNNEGSGKGSGFKIDIQYNKKYGEIYNPYECISVAIESKNKDFDYFRVDNIPFDNNETIITEQEAVEIALNEDKKIETNSIIKTEVKKKIVKMNTDAYERINNKEEYYKPMQTPNYPIEERNYYNIEDKVRYAWVVLITYDDNYGEDIARRYTEGKYAYYVDCTTGEIIGGNPSYAFWYDE